MSALSYTHEEQTQMSQGNWGGGGYGPPGGGGWGGGPGGGGFGPPPGGGPGGGWGGGPGGGGYGPPPGGGLEPGPGMGGPMMGPNAVFEERAPVTVLLLAFVTCSIYLLIWKYKTTEELRIATGDNSINPVLDLVLSIFTCGIWAIYTDYRNAKKAHELFQRYRIQREDRSTLMLILGIFGLAIISPLIMQEEYNALARAQRGSL